MDVDTALLIFPMVVVAGLGCILIGLCLLFLDLWRPGCARGRATLVEKGDVKPVVASIRFADQDGSEQTATISLNLRARIRYKPNDQIPVIYLHGQPQRVELNSLRLRGPLCVALGTLASGGATLLAIDLGSGIGKLMMR